MSESHNIWVQYIDIGLDNIFPGRLPTSPSLNFSWTRANRIWQVQKRMPPGTTISIIYNRCHNTYQWITRPQPQRYAAVIPTKYKPQHRSAGCVDGFIRLVKYPDMIHIVPVRGIVGTAHLVRGNPTSDRIDSVWLVNYHVDWDSCWTVYWSHNVWIEICSRKMVDGIELFDVKIIAITSGEYASRF
jgi:hypothetical protein